ncbi:hypothetical protein [Shewanella woodyi]|nr:hypothetical protein [Shewanella woodyi]
MAKPCANEREAGAELAVKQGRCWITEEHGGTQRGTKRATTEKQPERKAN